MASLAILCLKETMVLLLIAWPSCFLIRNWLDVLVRQVDVVQPTTSMRNDTCQLFWNALP